ncbi:MAG: hypothetical protein DRP99_06350, partial [Candidatus Latescibacterota bacterium]
MRTCRIGLALLVMGFPLSSHGEAFFGLARKDSEGLKKLVSSSLLSLLRKDKFHKLEVRPDFGRRVVRLSEGKLSPTVEVGLEEYLEAQLHDLLRREWYAHKGQVPKDNPSKRRDLEIELPVKFPKVME